MVGFHTNPTADMMSMPDYNAQMESFKRSDEAREGMMRDILERYELLLRERTELKQDYAMEQSMRRSLQGRVEQLESVLKGVVSGASKRRLALPNQLTRPRITTPSF
jgi:hypothetical protein